MLDRMRNIIEVTGLTKRFGSLAAVNNLSLDVMEGETFGLLGPNGAGKTTTIKMLTTLLLPTSGNAKIGGHDVVKNAYEVRKIIGYVPQLISTDPMLTGLENLTVFAKLYDVPAKTRKSQIDEAFEFMGLMDAKNKLVKNYSGGMVRRLEIAQSLLHKPKILFLDEPTVGLDPVARKMMWEHIAKLKTEFGTTIFLTTHYMEEADFLCDRVAIMDHGAFSALDAPARLKDILGGDVVSLELEGDAAAFLDALGREEWVKRSKLAEGVLSLTLERGERRIAELVVMARRHGVGVSCVNLRKPSLEDVFLHFTGRTIREQEATASERNRARMMHPRRRSS